MTSSRHGAAVRPDGPPIARYEHASTRRHVNLVEHGNADRDVHAPERAAGGTYARVPLELAIDAGSERTHGVNGTDPRSMPHVGAYRRARDDARRRARLTVVELYRGRRR